MFAILWLQCADMRLNARISSLCLFPSVVSICLLICFVLRGFVLQPCAITAVASSAPMQKNSTDDNASRVNHRFYVQEYCGGTADAVPDRRPLRSRRLAVGA